MNKSSIISATLQSLEKQATDVYVDLLTGRDEFNFLLEAERECTGSDEEILEELKETGELTSLPMIEFRDSKNGVVFDAYVTKVTDRCIKIITEEHEEKEYSFRHLSSLEDRLILLNEMEELPK